MTELTTKMVAAPKVNDLTNCPCCFSNVSVIYDVKLNNSFNFNPKFLKSKFMNKKD